MVGLIALRAAVGVTRRALLSGALPAVELRRGWDGLEGVRFLERRASWKPSCARKGAPCRRGPNSRNLLSLIFRQRFAKNVVWYGKLREVGGVSEEAKGEVGGALRGVRVLREDVQVSLERDKKLGVLYSLSAASLVVSSTMSPLSESI